MAGNQQKQKKSKSKGLSIRWKLILGILPIVIIALIGEAMYMGQRASAEMTKISNREMQATLGEHTNTIADEMNQIKRTTSTLAQMVGSTYKTTEMSQYKQALSDIVKDNEMVLGSGLWFEPYVYNSDEKYMGPYWYKDKDSSGNVAGILEEWGYSNAEYDYFNQEYYLNAKGIDGYSAVITDPYYDETSAMVMASCSAPIRDPGGNFIGCVTVDVMLDSVVNRLSEIKVGETGTIWLIDSSYKYVYHPGVKDALINGMSIDESDEMGSTINLIKQNDTGTGSFQWEGQTRDLFWDTVPDMGWKMGLTITTDEVTAPIVSVVNTSMIIAGIVTILCAVLIIVLANGIAKAMIQVQAFAGSLAEGDFTVEPLSIRRKDEIGAMADSLNEMYRNNSDVIRNIGEGSTRVNDSSNQLSNTSMDLLARFQEISAAMSRVNDAMTNTGAATEEVSASANEVDTSVARLAQETDTTKSEAVAIIAKAAEIEKAGQDSSEYAIMIAEKRGMELEAASEQAQVVSKISTLADSISEIASQINLLSLNATIEAARAGEHGRGFAVVATEINNLATATAKTVEEIQATVSEINMAFETLNKSSMDLLTFVRETVGPDYEKFIDVGRNYGEDARKFGDLADKIAEMAKYISVSMEQVNQAVASIADSAVETAEASSEVTETMGEVADMVENVSSMANDQQNVSQGLDDIVKQFSL